MTLSKQTIIILIAALSTLFLGTFLITVYQAKTYFEEQLERNAQDTATALGLSLSNQFGNVIDKGTMIAKVNAVFDRGYFCVITVRDIKKNTLVSRYLKNEHQRVPYWFIRILNFKNQPKSALIVHGWQQVGEVIVRSDMSLAYEALWQTVKKLFALFLLLTLFITIISVILIKVMFKPLKLIIQQAQDIGRKNFYILETKPKLKELNQLSTAINVMVRKLKHFFSMQIEETERLRAKAYKDNLTGRGNKNYFLQQLKQYLSSEDDFSPGFLVIIEIAGLAEFNAHYSYSEGDEVIKTVSNKLGDILFDKNLFLTVRLDRPSFATIIIERHRENIEAVINEIYIQIEKLVKRFDKSLSCIIAAVKCDFNEDASALLLRADKAINQAKRTRRTHYYIEPEIEAEEIISKEHWHEKIISAIQEEKFNLYSQPVQSPNGIYHKECFIKLADSPREISAREFFPIAEQYNLGLEIDEYVLNQIAHLKKPETFALNLSISTINTEKKQQHFLSLVEKIAKTGKTKLHFEISEVLLDQSMNTAVPFINHLVQLGYTVGLDRVGATIASLEHLKKLNIAYLKLDGSLSKDVEENKFIQDFIIKLVTTCHSLDIIPIATAVENESQFNYLKKLGIAYFQGNYIEPPTLLLSVKK
ncbi:bifunctional diguanylate cyclase/phosphodiesterase [Legionella septentrionalis]|uniref:EAL domain-containing protein n=1 Tax=Legionella septentrionalis TaxID=2498109 RepID=A0A433JHD7_9GAMM|nr:EAL domain-containing protein [Legionella septentrionalis]RUQ81780.1 EAL domain-containing protein [Legionella septentrionalis]RUR17363.1 EAL domain-containing protein [Legionella septentrionalis]